MIKLPDIQHLSLQRVREIAEGATPVMGEVQRLAVTALGYVEENKSAVKAFESTGFILLEREQELEEALAEVQRLNATAQPVSDGWVKCSERMPESDGHYLVFANASTLDGYCDHNDIACYQQGKWSNEFNWLVTHWMPLPAAPGGQDD